MNSHIELAGGVLNLIRAHRDRRIMGPQAPRLGAGRRFAEYRAADTRRPFSGIEYATGDYFQVQA